jgi:hypothetical protein
MGAAHMLGSAMYVLLCCCLSDCLSQFWAVRGILRGSYCVLEQVQRGQPLRDMKGWQTL